MLNFFSNLPFGQVKSLLSDFYLPERKIYLPKNNNPKKKNDEHYFSLILANKVFDVCIAFWRAYSKNRAKWIIWSISVTFLDVSTFDDQIFTCPIGQVNLNTLIFYLPNMEFYLPRANGQVLVSSPAYGTQAVKVAASGQETMPRLIVVD